MPLFKVVKENYTTQCEIGKDNFVQDFSTGVRAIPKSSLYCPGRNDGRVFKGRDELVERTLSGLGRGD